jgi:hypothetical protein
MKKDMTPTWNKYRSSLYATPHCGLCHSTLDSGEDKARKATDAHFRIQSGFFGIETNALTARMCAFVGEAF